MKDPRLSTKSDSEESKSEKGRDSVTNSTQRPIDRVLRQFDPDRTNEIDGVNFIFSVINGGYRFRNKEAYYILKGYPKVIDRNINYDNFKQIFSYLDLSEAEVENFSIESLDFSKADLSLLGIDFNSIDFKNLGIGQTKKKDLESLFQEIFEGNTDKESYKLLKTHIEKKLSNIVPKDQIFTFLNELDIGIETLSSNNLRICLTTKQGCLTIINLRRILKTMKDENMISKLEFINENEYVSKNFKKSAFLNLIEAYETLDIEGRGFIHISLLQKHAPTIKQSMMADEENIFNTLITAHTVELNFSDFFKLYSGQIKRKTLSIKDIKALAKRIGKINFRIVKSKVTIGFRMRKTIY